VSTLRRSYFTISPVARRSRPALSLQLQQRHRKTATFTFPDSPREFCQTEITRAILYGERVKDSGAIPMAADSNFSFTVYNGDANGDSAINSLDFNALASNWGKASPTYTQGDLNYDTKVNTLDFNVLATKFNTTYAAPAAPPRVIDVTTFKRCPRGSAKYFTQNMFNHMNIPQAAESSS
jgi:hypothetical protein